MQVNTNSTSSNTPSLTTQSLRNAVDSLREALRLKQVVAVIGPDALTVQITDADGHPRVAPFYRLVAERLLTQNNLSADRLDTPSHTWDLHRATAAIMAQTGLSAARLRRSVSSTIRELTEQVQAVGALAALAQLRCFDLIVCLTPDELLSRALQAAQSDTTVEVASYAPRADSSQSVDIPPARAGQIRLFHPLGRTESTTEFAIHEEDALEYLYRFRDDGERRAKTLLTALRGNDLLFLGCSLPDWMGRGLMRLVNDQRLSANDRTMEFFCARARDASLTGFLDRFSTNSIVFPWEPEEFVDEIARLALPPGRPTPAAPAPAPTRPHQAPSAFVSYASQDSEAAQQIARSLIDLGFGDVWLDRKALVTGDDWSARIDEAIGRCDYFVPLLSQQADQRREGVFWEEWRKAIARSIRVYDAFLLPIGIDERPPTQMKYERIFTGPTKAFADLHLLHARDGRLDTETQEQLRRRAQTFAQGAGRG